MFPLMLAQRSQIIIYFQSSVFCDRYLLFKWRPQKSIYLLIFSRSTLCEKCLCVCQLAHKIHRHKVETMLHRLGNVWMFFLFSFLLCNSVSLYAYLLCSFYQNAETLVFSCFCCSFPSSCNRSILLREIWTFYTQKKRLGVIPCGEQIRSTAINV